MSQLLLVLAYAKLNRHDDAAELFPKAAALGISSALSSDVVKLFKKLGPANLERVK